MLISGDMVLPKISTNVSVWPEQPEGDPLQLFLDSLDRYAQLPPDTLVLPSHGLPFRGLRKRIAAAARPPRGPPGGGTGSVRRPVTAARDRAGAVPPRAGRPPDFLRDGRGDRALEPPDARRQGGPQRRARRGAALCRGLTQHSERPMATSTDSPQPGKFQPPTPDELAREFAQIAEHSQRVVGEFLSRVAAGQGGYALGRRRRDQRLHGPGREADGQSHAARRGADAHVARLLPPVAQLDGALPRARSPRRWSPPSKSDNRFKSEVWENNFLFDYIKQSYLIAAQNIQSTVAEVQGLDAQTARKVAVLHAPVRRRAGADQLRVYQPRGAQDHDRLRRPQPDRRPAQPARRPRARRRPACDQHDRLLGVQARRERGHRARQGRVPERPDPAASSTRRPRRRCGRRRC